MIQHDGIAQVNYECRTCKWFKPYDGTDPRLATAGSCHRYAPSPRVSDDWEWPWVNMKDWCGEYHANV